MALVAYDFSDDSDTELEPEGKSTINFENVFPPSVLKDSKASVSHLIDDEEVEIILQTSKENSALLEETDSSDEEDEPVQVSFSNLPKPNYHSFNTYETKVKNLKLTSRIKVLPIQSQDPKSELHSERNGQKLNFKKESGLLSVLPKPENAESVEVTKTYNVSANLIPAAAKTTKNKTTNKPPISKINYEDEDIGTDFFSLSKNYAREEGLSEDVDIDLPVIESNITLNNFPESHSLLNLNGRNDEVQNQAAPENSDRSQNLDLDEEVLQKICGRKRKRLIPENIQIIDINEAEILAKSKAVASKHFTDEVMCNPAPSKCNSSTLSKRKHQITYLAFQAKERELELKNQWATNRATRKQTQSKYGF